MSMVAVEHQTGPALVQKIQWLSMQIKRIDLMPAVIYSLLRLSQWAAPKRIIFYSRQFSAIKLDKEPVALYLQPPPSPETTESAPSAL